MSSKKPDDVVKSAKIKDSTNAEDETPFIFEGKFDDEVILLFDDGNKLFVSRNFLCLASPVFLNMFTLDFKEKQTGVVEMKGKSYCNVLVFLLYLHPNQCRQLSDDNVFCILSLAEEYCNNRTIRDCKEKLSEMTDKNYQIVKNQIIKGGSDEILCTKVVTKMLKCLEIVVLYGYETLEDNLTTVLGKISSHVYAQPKLREMEPEDSTYNKSYFPSEYMFNNQEIFDHREKCNKAYDALPDKVKLNILHKRLLNIEDHQLF